MVTMLGWARTALSGTRSADPVVAAQQLEEPGLVGVADGEAAGGAGAEARSVAIWPSRLMAWLAVVHCCRMSSQLAAVALLHVRVGGEDGRVQVGGGAVQGAELVHVDAALFGSRPW